MSTVTVENKKGRKKEFRLLLKIVSENNRKYLVYTDDIRLNDGSLHTIVSVLNKNNLVLKTKPSYDEMKYIEKFLVSLCRE